MLDNFSNGCLTLSSVLIFLVWAFFFTSVHNRGLQKDDVCRVPCDVDQNSYDMIFEKAFSLKTYHENMIIFKMRI